MVLEHIHIQKAKKGSLEPILYLAIPALVFLTALVLFLNK
jgi:hypothetical protein